MTSQKLLKKIRIFFNDQLLEYLSYMNVFDVRCDQKLKWLNDLGSPVNFIFNNLFH